MPSPDSANPGDLGGLSDIEALEKLERDGYNDLPVTERRPFIRIAIGALREPMVVLLLSCGGVYMLLGDAQEASTLLAMLGLILGITIYQEQRTEHALETLRQVSSPRALVIRNGVKKRIAGREVVVGDVVVVHEGDRVPADGRILSCTNFFVDESLLTGEAFPVMKDRNHDTEGRSGVFSGSIVVKGTAIIKVTRTGRASELGRIGGLLHGAASEPSNLEKEIRYLVKIASVVAAGLCILVVIVYALYRHHWLSGLLAGLTLAMAILPNELPAVLTIFLALGAWRMASKRVLTRRPAAIEALGMATVLCVDKTGTLTYNRMAVRHLSVNGESYDLLRHSSEPLPEQFHELIEYAILASETHPFDAMEEAFRRVGDEYLAQTEHIHPDWLLLKQYPLSPGLLALSQVWQGRDRTALPIAAKGSPEAIVDLCHLDEARASQVMEHAKTMAEEGLRILAVAKGRALNGELPTNQHAFDFEYIGLIALEDPIRSGVAQAIRECHTAGIRVIMITGDHPETARSIARQIGMDNPDDLITGDQLEVMPDQDLVHRVRSLCVCARMAPGQKLRLINALKANGEVVAMTGDGTNDAPALKNAHIGIAMGQRGTDVARDSASLVLLDDDFASIVGAIRMGRRVYANLQHAMAYLLAVHIPIAGLSVFPVLFNLPLMLLPVHVVFLHLIIEPVSSIVFESEESSEESMHRPPRSIKEPLLSQRILRPVLIQGTSVLVILILVFTVSLYGGYGESDGRALSFATLVVANLGLILGSRTLGISKSARPSSGNRTLGWIVFCSIGLLAAVLYVPTMRELFQFSVLHPIDLLICTAGGVVSSLWFYLLGDRARRPSRKVG